MNRYGDDLQHAIALLGDHIGHAQLLVRSLADSRALENRDIDPETELAIVCWLEEAADLMGVPRDRLLRRRDQHQG
jgi:hypothetical protein